MEQVHGIGRRKRAVARVYLRPGTGQIRINGKTSEDYFGKRTGYQEILKAALVETQTLQQYDMIVTLRGGGTIGQVEAVRLGCARALEKINPAFRPALKSLGYLTRDAREKERKKYGQPKARKKFQFSKR